MLKELLFKKLEWDNWAGKIIIILSFGPVYTETGKKNPGWSIQNELLPSGRRYGAVATEVVQKMRHVPRILLYVNDPTTPK